MIKKGMLLRVFHKGKGVFFGHAKRDFNKDKENFFPIYLAYVVDDGTVRSSRRSDHIPFPRSLCNIEILDYSCV